MPRRLWQEISSTVFLRAIHAAVQLAVHLFLARILGAREYGIFSFTVGLVSLLTITVPMGWPLVAMRYAPEYTATGKWECLRGVLVRSFRATLSLALIASGALWGASYWLALPAPVTVGFRAGGLLLVVAASSEFRRRAFEGLGRVRTGVLTEEIFPPAAFLVLLTMLSLTRADVALWTYFAVWCLVFFVGSFFLCRAVPPPARKVPPQFEALTWRSAALLLMAGRIGSTAVDRIDVVLLQALAGPSAVGIYNAPNRVSRANSIVSLAVYAISVSRLGKAHAANDRRLFQRTLAHLTLGGAVVVLPIVLSMILFSEFLIPLIGPEYANSARLLRVLAVARFWETLFGPIAAALFVSGRHREYAFSGLLITGVATVANLMVIPYMGAFGAAWVLLASKVLLGLIQYQFLRRSWKESE